jgi:hypothetical protein
MAPEFDFNSRTLTPIDISHWAWLILANLACKGLSINIVNGLYGLVFQGYQHGQLTSAGKYFPRDSDAKNLTADG